MISPVCVCFVNIDIRKFEITHVTWIVFLLDSAVLEPEKTNLYKRSSLGI